ncbi:MAG: ACP S-malonyltransferase, partial [Planctomycetota bacterium]|nr:ACP S-malonyltransferase [Planctomycetota bacterium]
MCIRDRVGMGQDLYRNYYFVKEIYDQADEFLGFSISKICFEGPMEELTKTDKSQLAIFITSIAVAEVARYKGVLDGYEIAATCGLSLGEYTALVFAGSLSFIDALRIVHHRGIFMQQACEKSPSGMVSVIGLEHKQVEELVEETRKGGVLVAANYNSPTQVAVSGDLSALERFEAAAKEAGAARVVRLAVAGAFHSPLMSSAAKRLIPFIDSAPLKKPNVKFLSNVTGDFESEPDKIKENLKLQVDHPVRWSQTMQKILDTGVRTFFEFGPGTVLSGIIKKMEKDVVTRAFLANDSFKK